MESYAGKGSRLFFFRFEEVSHEMLFRNGVMVMVYIQQLAFRRANVTWWMMIVLGLRLCAQMNFTLGAFTIKIPA
jgi:hypothetical protein